MRARLRSSEELSEGLTGCVELVDAARFTTCAVAEFQACVLTGLIAINITAAGRVLAVCEMMNSVETLNVSAQRS